MSQQTVPFSRPILASFAMFSFRYPEKEELQNVYSTFLQPIMQKSLPKSPIWNSPGKCQQLATSMINVYENVILIAKLSRVSHKTKSPNCRLTVAVCVAIQVRQRFKSDDYGHYLFTPRDVTRWMLSFLRYNFEETYG